MDSLTDGEVRALRNLLEKQTGNATAFLNIADAQRLVALGFASRGRQGWDITDAGVAHLAGLAKPTEPSASVTELHHKTDDGDG